MTHSRELDALVATKVMGLTLSHIMSHDLKYCTRCRRYSKDLDTTKANCDSSEKYSTDITAAWEVVEKLNELGWEYSIAPRMVFLKRRVIEFVDMRHFETIPHGICLAALKAVGGEIK